MWNQLVRNIDIDLAYFCITKLAALFYHFLASKLVIFSCDKTTQHPTVEANQESLITKFIFFTRVSGLRSSYKIEIRKLNREKELRKNLLPNKVVASNQSKGGSNTLQCY